MRSELADLPLEPTTVPGASSSVEKFLSQATAVLKRSESLQGAAQKSYVAWMGYYKSNLKKCGFSPTSLVQAANKWAFDVGLESQPRLQRKTIGKMGMKGVPGILVE